MDGGCKCQVAKYVLSFSPLLSSFFFLSSLNSLQILSFFIHVSSLFSSLASQQPLFDKYLRIAKSVCTIRGEAERSSSWRWIFMSKQDFSLMQEISTRHSTHFMGSWAYRIKTPWLQIRGDLLFLRTNS